MGSSEYYINNFSNIFNIKNTYEEFIHLTLSFSHRINKYMSMFINNCMLGLQRIKSEKDGEKVNIILYEKKHI